MCVFVRIIPRYTKTMTQPKKLRDYAKQVIPKGAFDRIEPTGHLVEAALIATASGRPAQHMHVIGVTGTNGKTTTSFMIHSILVEAGMKTALMTTVGYGVGKNITSQIEHMTTVSPRTLQQRLRAFRDNNVEWLVMEVTSHALAQHREWGTPYEIAVLTNVTHEHLDYHKTFENYRDAKLKLFKNAARHGRKLGIVNADDPSADIFASAVPNVLSYGIVKGDARPQNVQLRSDGSEYDVTLDDLTYHIRCNLPGEFNVANSLAAVCVGHSLGLPKTAVEVGIANLKSVEGRMNAINEGQPYSAIVDFAHTPDAFERLLSDLRKATKGKLVVLFGSAGRRDESKRAEQGRIAGKYADELVLTEEDDRDIDGNEILEQIASGAREFGKIDNETIFKILDRTEAIHFAVTRVAKPEDTVIFLGKGHEKTIERADGEHEWSERDEVTQAISRQQTANRKAHNE